VLRLRTIAIYPLLFCPFTLGEAESNFLIIRAIEIRMSQYLDPVNRVLSGLQFPFGYGTRNRRNSLPFSMR